MNQLKNYESTEKLLINWKIINQLKNISTPVEIFRPRW